MASNEFIQLAKKIVERDKASFDSLMEFEEQKKLHNKIRLNFTIDKSTAQRFRKLCQKKGYSMSAKVEQALQKILREES